MSTDTRYFNSSRLMSASGKNKTNGVTRLDKKRTQAEKKNKMRQETVVIPQPQLLPNGGKPDFGHSSSRRKQRSSSSGRHVSSSDPEARKSGEKQANTQQVTEDLKQLFLKPEDGSSKGKTKGSGEKSRKAKQGRPATSPSSSENRSVGFQSPDLHTAPIRSPLQGHNPVSSPVFVGPGLYPPPSPSSAPQKTYQGFLGHAYGNYSLASPAPGPHFMAPQAPLMNPLYPQLPLTQLPVMYKALDIQQQQQQVMSGYPPQNYHHYQSQHPQHPQQFNLSNLGIPYSLPVSASYCNGSPVTAVKPLEQEKPRKKTKDKTNATNTCFAGASFASSDPKVTNLPKPSFTKA
ncbi:hypothetical protein HG536_0D05630 [Torulaspora globosa]|uniref:Enhancer of mRNA-decapping protein 1 n=1 Tax=Torulaspora globosa TaxID=48254 RepID=A0A7G3ZHQ6_9SACH|nr:uncharacterized protein HG536_0D05630 [Torulaspora globosa]QLL33042.1 hypothetical protein HG536_0D05630 [Torulaspora globosa]